VHQCLAIRRSPQKGEILQQLASNQLAVQELLETNSKSKIQAKHRETDRTNLRKNFRKKNTKRCGAKHSPLPSLILSAGKSV
jgi:hypothetical protein